jgi:hypothetical protein
MNLKLGFVMLTVILAVVSLSSYVAYSLYVITSNTIEVSVAPKATLTLSANATNLVSGVDCLRLMAHLSDNLSEQTVAFYQNSILIGTAITDSSGNASYNVGPLTAGHSYYATVMHP